MGLVGGFFPLRSLELYGCTDARGYLIHLLWLYVSFGS